MQKRSKLTLVVLVVMLMSSLSCNNDRFLFLFDMANDSLNTAVVENTATTRPIATSATPRLPTATKALATATLRSVSTTAPRSPTPVRTATTGPYTARGQFLATADMYCDEWTCTISGNTLEMTVDPIQGKVTGLGTVKLVGDRAGCPPVETTMTFDFTSLAYSDNWFNGTVVVTSNRLFPKERCSAATSFSSSMPWEARVEGSKISGSLIGANNAPFPFALTRVP